MATTNNGLSGGLEQTTLPVAMTLSALTAIAWYNALDINVVIWMTFKKRQGLYFYSLLASSWGIFIFALAFLMKFFQVWKNDYVSVVFITIGWYAMVTGQSLVLYSRLHLVVRDRHRFKWVLYMIIIDIFLFHVPTTVMTFGANSPAASLFEFPYSVMEKIQVTAFFVQECIISGLYVYWTRQILSPGQVFQKKRTRQVMMHLIYVNILVILMDITLLCTQYANLYEIQITLKGAVYSVKLRLEFAILNQLRSIVSPNDSSNDNPNSVYHHTGREDISLNTFNNRNLTVQGRLNDGTPRNYTCSASGQTTSPFADKMDDGCVVMTTEVVVKRDMPNEQNVKRLESGESLESIPRTGDHTTIATHGQTTLQMRSSTPSSSVVEFAGAGY